MSDTRFPFNLQWPPTPLEFQQLLDLLQLLGVIFPQPSALQPGSTSDNLHSVQLLDGASETNYRRFPTRDESVFPQEINDMGAPLSRRPSSRQGPCTRNTTPEPTIQSPWDTHRTSLDCNPTHTTISAQTPKQRVNRTKKSRISGHPYPIPVFRKSSRPAAKYVSDVDRVQDRCLADGAEPAAVALFRSIFTDGISQAALKRPMTREEAREHCGGTTGQVYRTLLRIDEDERHRCRLCPAGFDEGGWKNARDALRHLRRDHFGLGDRCRKCNKLVYTNGEMTNHCCRRRIK